MDKRKIVRCLLGMIIGLLARAAMDALLREKRKAREMAVRQCLSCLWKKSDALYGITVSGKYHEMRVLLCARFMRNAERVSDLAGPFNSHFRECARPPEVEDILRRMRARGMA